MIAHDRQSFCLARVKSEQLHRDAVIWKSELLAGCSVKYMTKHHNFILVSKLYI